MSSHSETRRARQVPNYSFISRIRYWLWRIKRLIVSLVERVESGNMSEVYIRLFLAIGVKEND